MYIFCYIGCWLPKEVWLQVISLAVGNEDILTYQSLSAVSKQKRALLQSLPKPTPSIQLSEDVCAILSICPFAFEVVLSYDRLKQAAGLFSSVSKRLTELLPRLQPEKTLLVIHGNHFFGQQDFILASILHCKHETTNCEYFHFDLGNFIAQIQSINNSHYNPRVEWNYMSKSCVGWFICLTEIYFCGLTTWFDKFGLFQLLYRFAIISKCNPQS